MAEEKIAVYICHCGTNIAGKVDVEKVTAWAAEQPNVVVSREYKYMCSDPGQDLIKQDIQESGVNRIVVAEKVARRLTGLRVAPYYGCQYSRPMGTFDDVQFPVTMDKLFEAMGADVIADFDAKTDCCGGMMMLTHEAGALRLCHELLVAARQYKADVIVAACPLCEMNLEGYQARVNKTYGTDFNIPVMFFTQLAGLALGADPKQLAIDKQVVSCAPVLAAIPA
jgi:heterodisulfide reductase subunit B